MIWHFDHFFFPFISCIFNSLEMPILPSTKMKFFTVFEKYTSAFHHTYLST